jgi:transposase
MRAAAHTIRAVSIDMSGGYEQTIRENITHAEICFDSFHVVRLWHAHPGA